METMKNKFFLRNRRESQPHSSSKTKTNAVRRTLDSSGLGNASAPTSFQSPNTTHAPDSCSFADEPQTHEDAGGLVWSSSPQAVVEDPSPALTPGADASAERQSTAVTFAFRHKSGKARKLWKRVYGKVTLVSGLRDSKQSTGPPVDIASITQPQTSIPITTNSHNTSILVLASSDQTGGALCSATAPVGLSSTALTHSDGHATSPVSNTTVSLAPHIEVARGVVQDNTSAVATILRDLGEIAENIPFIKAVAGATLVLLKIRDEMEDVDESITELVDDVWRRSLQLIESLDKVTCPNGVHWINGQIEQSLLNYQTLLETLVSDLLVIKSQGSVRKALERVATRKKIEGYRRRLHSFDSTFSTSALVAILRQLETVVERAEHLVGDEYIIEIPNYHAHGAAVHSIADTMAFVITELAHKSLITTDRLVMQHFVGGDESKMLFSRAKTSLPFFFFDPRIGYR